MSLSLIAVFVPVLLMGGLIGRLFREFAMTLSTAIMISLIVSLTVTPMMCAYLLADQNKHAHGRVYLAGERVFDPVLNFCNRTLRRARQWQAVVISSLFATLGAAIYLSVIIPKGLFCSRTTG